MTVNPIATLKRIVAATNVPQYKRIEALRTLDHDAPIALLDRLLKDDSTPGRLRALCADLLLQKIALKQGDTHVGA